MAGVCGLHGGRVRRRIPSERVAHTLDRPPGSRLIMPTKHASLVDPEFTAITQVHTALRNLDPGAQVRVIEYVADKLGVLGQLGMSTGERRAREPEPADRSAESAEKRQPTEPPSGSADDDGINSVALKWM